MTGGVDGGIHITDVTNASRTMLMDLATLQWDDDIAGEMGIPMSMLPQIRSSSEVYGVGRAAGIAGGCADRRRSWATSRPRRSGRPASTREPARTPTAPATSSCSTPAPNGVVSKNGLLTTVCYRIGEQPPVYALEGSIAVTGSLVQWLRDNLGLIGSAAEVETLAASGRGQRRRLLRAGLLRAVRPLLAQRRPRGAGRADPLRHEGPHRPGGARGHRLPDPRGGRGDASPTRG